MTTTVQFSIKYDGPALASHQMDIRDIASAMVALGNLLEEANRQVFADKAVPLQTWVKGNFKAGSFGIDLVAVQSTVQQLVSMFSGQSATAANNLIGLLTALGLIGGGGVIGLIRWLKGRKPDQITQENGNFRVGVIEAECVEMYELTLIEERLYSSRIIRQSLEKIVSPLAMEGVDIFSCHMEGHAPGVVLKADLSAFALSANQEDIASDILLPNVLLEIEAPVFKEGNKWRFHDGTHSFHAEVCDDAFMQQIELGGERFGKHDILIVDLRRVQTITDNGLKQSYHVLKVHEHRSAPQSPFDFDR